MNLVNLIVGDCTAELARLPDESVNAIVTSPPYYGQRDYGVHGQHGLEETLSAYLDSQVAVFREARRVLRRDGVCWVVMGDSYVNDPGGAQGIGGERFSRAQDSRLEFSKRNRARDLKTKDLMLVPHALAAALRADGWWLRQDCVWEKPNPYPEAARDRPTRSHDYVFMLVRSATTKWWRHADTREWARPKPAADYRWIDRATFGQVRHAMEPAGDWPAERFEFRGKQYKRWARVNAWEGYDYWYDADAVAEQASARTKPRGRGALPKQRQIPSFDDLTVKDLERIEQGLRPHARMGHGNGWRQREDVARAENPWISKGRRDVTATRNKRSVWHHATVPYKGAHFATFPPSLIVDCILSSCPEGGTVLDFYAGTGTTGAVARDLGRNAILIELNPTYAEQARARLQQPTNLKQLDLLRRRRR